MQRHLLIFNQNQYYLRKIVLMRHILLKLLCRSYKYHRSLRSTMGEKRKGSPLEQETICVFR